MPDDPGIRLRIVVCYENMQARTSCFLTLTYWDLDQASRTKFREFYILTVKRIVAQWVRCIWVRAVSWRSSVCHRPGGSAERPKGLQVAVLSRSFFSQCDVDFGCLRSMRETRGSVDRDHTGTHFILVLNKRELYLVTTRGKTLRVTPRGPSAIWTFSNNKAVYVVCLGKWKLRWPNVLDQLLRRTLSVFNHFVSNPDCLSALVMQPAGSHGIRITEQNLGKCETGYIWHSWILWRPGHRPHWLVEKAQSHSVLSFGSRKKTFQTGWFWVTDGQRVFAVRFDNAFDSFWPTRPQQSFWCRLLQDSERTKSGLMERGNLLMRERGDCQYLQLRFVRACVRLCGG